MFTIHCQNINYLSYVLKEIGLRYYVILRDSCTLTVQWYKDHLCQVTLYECKYYTWVQQALWDKRHEAMMRQKTLRHSIVCFLISPTVVKDSLVCTIPQLWVYSIPIMTGREELCFYVVISLNNNAHLPRRLIVFKSLKASRIQSTFKWLKTNEYYV